MEPLFDLSSWRAILVEALSQMGSNVAGFLPNLAAAMLILALGWLLSRALAAIAQRALRTIGVDRAARRLQISGLLERAEIRLSVSELSARMVFWLLMLVFILSSVETLGLTAVTATIDRLIGFIPNLLGAAVIVLAGLLLARVVAGIVGSGAAAVGLESGPRLAFVVQVLAGGFVLVIAAEQLGVETSVLVLPFTVLLGVSGAAAGLAFALGAHPVITHILAGHFLRRSLPLDGSVEVEGRRGRVQRVGPVDTLIASGDETWSIPNGRLLEHTVVR